MSIFAWTKIEETFPVQVSLYCLSRLIEVVEKQEEPTLTFVEGSVLVKSGKSRAKIGFDKLSIVEAVFPRLPFEPTIKVPPGSEFLASIDRSDIAKVGKLSSSMGLNFIQAVVVDGVAILRAVDDKQTKGNKFELGLKKGIEMENFTASIGLDSFSVLADDDYDLYVIRGKGLFFKGKDFGMNYVITVDVALSEF